jgi:hypothetical protein
MAQPRNPDAIADCELVARILAHRNDFGDHFVSGYDIRPVNRQISLGDMQIGAAHTTRPHGNENFALAG